MVESYNLVRKNMSNSKSSSYKKSNPKVNDVNNHQKTKLNQKKNGKKTMLDEINEHKH